MVNELTPSQKKINLIIKILTPIIAITLAYFEYYEISAIFFGFFIIDITVFTYVFLKESFKKEKENIQLSEVKSRWDTK